jgi:nitrogenase molybdenum-iron protein beta chain
VIITDNPPEESREIIVRRLTDTERVIKPEIIFEVDSGKIREILREHNFVLLLASQQEKYFVVYRNIDYVQHRIDRYLNADVNSTPIVHVTIAFPAFNRLILDRSHLGYLGGSALIEDIGSTLAALF